MRSVSKMQVWTQRGGGGLLQSLPVPSHPREDISMDMILVYHQQRWSERIFTFVDRLIKMVHLVPTTSTLDSRGAALLYMNKMSFTISLSDVERALRALNAGKAPAFDGIPTRLLVILKDEIVHCVHHIFTLSLIQELYQLTGSLPP